ncbi:hypothetical protein LTS18_001911 [Coniosporium uncinatum]|uniref:Uncharacterized protein n=1 Tax=Coniosporium uncinatum TaxID=93489 RepID=A0ACC3D850_9PEZI|nr:hypothetical protein LTS18_001911 [Coniosporium uncinatum]
MSTPDLSKKEKTLQNMSGSGTVDLRQCRSADGVLPAVASTHAVKESPQERERRYYGPVRDTSDAAVRQLIVDILEEKYPGRFPEHGWIIEKKSEGTFHRVFAIKPYDLPNDGKSRSKLAQKLCLRIPLIGHQARWTDTDGECLRTEALTMKYIRRHTNLAVLEILGYEHTLDNRIHAPFILMEFVSGQPVSQAWYFHDGPKSRPERRRNIVCSLARQMAELKKLQFSEIRMLHFARDDDDSPTVQPWIREEKFKPGEPQYDATDPEFARKLVPMPVQNTAKAYFEMSASRSDPCLKTDFLKGVRALTRLAIDNFPIRRASSGWMLPRSATHDGPDLESFGLAHMDLNKQNVIVDHCGNVTGILDWQWGSHCAVIHELGWCAYLAARRLHRPVLHVAACGRRPMSRAAGAVSGAVCHGCVGSHWGCKGLADGAWVGCGGCV